MTYEDYLGTERYLSFAEMQDIHGQMLAGIKSDAEAKEIYNGLADVTARFRNRKI